MHYQVVGVISDELLWWCLIAKNFVLGAASGRLRLSNRFVSVIVRQRAWRTLFGNLCTSGSIKCNNPTTSSNTQPRFKCIFLPGHQSVVLALLRLLMSISSISASLPKITASNDKYSMGKVSLYWLILGRNTIWNVLHPKIQKDSSKKIIRTVFFLGMPEVTMSFSPDLELLNQQTTSHTVTDINFILLEEALEGQVVNTQWRHWMVRNLRQDERIWQEAHPAHPAINLQLTLD